MEMDKFEALKDAFQDVIDCISQKDVTEGNQKLAIAGNLLDEMLDLTISDEDLITMRQYQFLLKQLKEQVSLLN